MAIQLKKDHYVIFDKQGATRHVNGDGRKGLEECLALADSNADIDRPCSNFYRAKRIILTSSPTPQRWKEWMKQKNGHCVISGLPTVPEIAVIM